MNIGAKYNMERLQKVLAHSGVASRRKCEELIQNGHVSVDGSIITELGYKVDSASQTITVDGNKIEIEQKVCLMMYKPTSRITSVSDPEGRKTVMDLITGVEQRVYPVGRLDYDTSGLLLLTNDGELTNRLLHPSYHLEKVYRATVRGMVDKELISQLEHGIVLEDGKTAPADVHVLRQHPRESVVEITIHEGRNRQVRRMFDTLDAPVKRLKRIQFGPIELGDMMQGHWRYLKADEWNVLYQLVGLDPPPYPFATESKADVRSRRKVKPQGQKKFKATKQAFQSRKR